MDESSKRTRDRFVSAMKILNSCGDPEAALEKAKRPNGGLNVSSLERSASGAQYRTLAALLNARG
jgi:hypothetical protein